MPRPVKKDFLIPYQDQDRIRNIMQSLRQSGLSGIEFVGKGYRQIVDRGAAAGDVFCGSNRSLAFEYLLVLFQAGQHLGPFTVGYA